MSPVPLHVGDHHGCTNSLLWEIEILMHFCKAFLFSAALGHSELLTGMGHWTIKLMTEDIPYRLLHPTWPSGMGCVNADENCSGAHLHYVGSHLRIVTGGKMKNKEHKDLDSK